MLSDDRCLQLLEARGIWLSTARHYMLGLDTDSLSRMVDRLIFPIRDEYGQCVAFQGRALHKSMKPKYWHTAGDWKSLIVAGLYESIPKIAKMNLVILTESNMDVLIAHQLGVPCVPTMGVAFSPKQCLLLRRYTDKVILLAQKDVAGRKAALKVSSILAKYDLDATIEQLPNLKGVKDLNDLYLLKGHNYTEKFIGDIINA